MLVKPVLRDIPTFNALDGYTFKFDAIGGEQVAANRLIITQISNNTVKYDKTVVQYPQTHTVPVGILSNGVNYRAQVITRNGIKDANGLYSWSTPSKTLIFWCHYPPVVSITNIEYGLENLVRNQTFIFISSYSQVHGEPLESYRYILYHDDKSILRSFDSEFPDESGELTQEITGLENEKEYYLEVITNSPNGHSGSSGLVPFRARYEEPQIGVTLEARNRGDEGAVQISSTIVQILLKVYDNQGSIIRANDIEYSNNEAIDLNRADYGKIVADTGLYLKTDNYMLQVWLADVADKEMFIKLNSKNGRIEVFKSGDAIVAKKYLNSLDGFAAYRSNELLNLGADPFTVFIRSYKGALDLIIRRI